MSLRLKVFILITGSVLVPIVVFMISFRLDTDVESIRSYRALLAAHHLWKDELHNTVVDPADPEPAFKALTWATEIRLFDENGRPIYASAKAPYVDVDNKFYITEKLSVTLTTGAVATLIVTRPPGPVTQNEDRWMVPLTGLIFVTVMVIVIVQSMNRSIGRLDRATKRIAEGDLDFELPIKGHDKLASLTRSFDAMREHLKEEYARRSRFIMGISHDLKTPLSSISGYATAIGEGYADTPAKLTKYVGIIEDKTKLLESRISMLIDYVKRETTEWKLNLQPVALGPFLAEIVKVFESEAAITRRTFAARIELPAEIEIPMDEDMFIRAMENLMHNAISYSPDGSGIDLTAVANDDTVVLTLANEGPGINPDDLAHIFEPFVRGSKDRKGSGFGLGLSTVESVISSHGWSITAGSEPGLKTEFTILIPFGEQKRKET